jgi:hypothetical protein
MSDIPIDLRLTEGMKVYANYIARVIQNTMEELDSKNSSNEKVEERDHLLRSAIYTALYSYQYYKESEGARRFLEHHLATVPDTWEEPELLGVLGEESVRC